MFTINDSKQPDSKPDDNDVLIFRDNLLVSGTLNALILHMVPNGQYMPESTYLFAFLLSSRLFITPYELLGEIYKICEKQQNLSDSKATYSPQESEIRKLFSTQMIKVLREWIVTFPYDFRIDRVMNHFKIITQKCIEIDSSLSGECSKIIQNLLSRLKILENYEEFLNKINSCNDYLDQSKKPLHFPYERSAPQSNKNSNIVLNPSSFTPISSHQRNGSNSSEHDLDFLEFCSSPLHLAHQLTHIELERLYHIGPEEFVQAFAKENFSVSGNMCNEIKKTKNLECYVQWFNRLSFLVASETVRHIKKKQRVRLIEFWIETARECFNIGNFNSLMAIIAGLNMSPILRLRKTVCYLLY